MSHPHWRALCVALALGAAAASPLGPRPQAHAQVPDPFQAAWDAARAAWAKRGDPAQARAAITHLEKAVAAREDVEALVLLSRAAYFHGFLQEAGSMDERIRLYQRGYEAGKRAAELNPRSAGAHFWAATDLGTLGKAVGVMKSVQSYGEIRERLDTVTKLEPNYFHGGVHRYHGRLIDQVPGFLAATYGYDLDDAVAFYQKAIAVSPHYLQSRLFLAECYLLKEERTLAFEALQHILAADPRAMADLEPENRIFQAQAKRLMAQAFPSGGP